MKSLITTRYVAATLLILLCLVLFVTPVYTFAAEDFILIQPIPGLADRVDPDDIASFVNPLIRLIVVVAAFLAIIMIIIGGFEYMVSETPAAKSDGKSRIVGALGGLLLILLSVTILEVINPQIISLVIDKPIIAVSSQQFSHPVNTRRTPDVFHADDDGEKDGALVIHGTASPEYRGGARFTVYGAPALGTLTKEDRAYAERRCSAYDGAGVTYGLVNSTLPLFGFTNGVICQQIP